MYGVIALIHSACISEAHIQVGNPGDPAGSGGIWHTGLLRIARNGSQGLLPSGDFEVISENRIPDWTWISGVRYEQHSLQAKGVTCKLTRRLNNTGELYEPRKFSKKLALDFADILHQVDARDVSPD